VYILLLLFMQHWFNFITSALIKSHNRIQANILYIEIDGKGLHQRNLIIFRTFRNGVKRYMHCYQCNVILYCTINSVYILLTFQKKNYVIYALAIPFDLRCESGTYTHKLCIPLICGMVLCHQQLTTQSYKMWQPQGKNNFQHGIEIAKKRRDEKQGPNKPVRFTISEVLRHVKA